VPNLVTVPEHRIVQKFNSHPTGAWTPLVWGSAQTLKPPLCDDGFTGYRAWKEFVSYSVRVQTAELIVSKSVSNTQAYYSGYRTMSIIIAVSMPFIHAVTVRDAVGEKQVGAKSQEPIQ